MKTRELVGNAFLAAILVIVQVAFSFLPNIEFVSLLIILYTLVFEKRTVVIIYLFALLEGILYGFGVWWIMYLSCVDDFISSCADIQKEQQPASVGGSEWIFRTGVRHAVCGSVCSDRRNWSRNCMVDQRDSV